MKRAWSLANVDKGRGYWFDEHLLLEISGVAPDPCYVIDLVRSLLDVEPPSFTARWYRRPGICPQHVTPYHYREMFEIGARPDTVDVVHEGGTLTVKVEDYAPDREPTELLASAPGEGDELISNAHDPESRELLPLHEAVGYSMSWSLSEAMHEAIKALPPQRPNAADWPSRYVVVKIGASIGGLAGWSRLFARVRG